MVQRKSTAKAKAWSPAQATRQINEIARSDLLELALTAHAKERLNQRKLLLDDILYVLKNGFVYEKAEKTTRPNCFKYKIISSTPNSGKRQIGVIVIAKEKNYTLKIVTIMWIDEMKWR